MLLNIPYIAFLVTIPCSIIIIYYIKIIKHLRERQHNFSAASRKVQTDLNRTLVAQVLIQILVAFLPLSIHFLSAVTDLDLTLLSFVSAILYSWIPVGNALSVLIFVTAYRNKLSQILPCVQFRIPHISVSATTNGSS